MTIKFTGMKIVKKRGCSKCGKSQRITTTSNSHTFMTLSGRILQVKTGNSYDVTQEDGEFLVSSYPGVFVRCDDVESG